MDDAELLSAEKRNVATTSPLRQRWNRGWPPAAIAVALIVNIMWMSLLVYLIFTLADYLV